MGKDNTAFQRSRLGEHLYQEHLYKGGLAAPSTACYSSPGVAYAWSRQLLSADEVFVVHLGIDESKRCVRLRYRFGSEEDTGTLSCRIAWGTFTYGLHRPRGERMTLWLVKDRESVSQQTGKASEIGGTIPR